MTFRPHVGTKAVEDASRQVAVQTITAQLRAQGASAEQVAEQLADFDYKRDVPPLQRHGIGEQVMDLLQAAQAATVLDVLRALNDELSGVPMEQRGQRLQDLLIEAEISAADL